MKLEVVLTTILTPASQSKEQLLAHRPPVLKDKQAKPGHSPMHLSPPCCGEEMGACLGLSGCQSSSGFSDGTCLKE